MKGNDHNNINLISMENSLKYPKSPMKVEICQWFIDIARKFMIKESTIDKIKEDLNYEEVDRYPDGSWNPIKDMQELWKITDNTNIK